MEKSNSAVSAVFAESHADPKVGKVRAFAAVKAASSVESAVAILRRNRKDTPHITAYFTEINTGEKAKDPKWGLMLQVARGYLPIEEEDPPQAFGGDEPPQTFGAKAPEVSGNRLEPDPKGGFKLLSKNGKVVMSTTWKAQALPRLLVLEKAIKARAELVEKTKDTKTPETWEGPVTNKGKVLLLKQGKKGWYLEDPLSRSYWKWVHENTLSRIQAFDAAMAAAKK